MVETVAGKVSGGGSVTRVQPATAATPPIAVRQPAPERTTDSVSLSVLAQLAGKPPIDEARVAEIKKAIANGTFPISPATIADRLLAFKMNWNGNDQA